MIKVTSSPLPMAPNGSAVQTGPGTLAVGMAIGLGAVLVMAPASAQEIRPAVPVEEPRILPAVPADDPRGYQPNVNPAPPPAAPAAPADPPPAVAAEPAPELNPGSRPADGDPEAQVELPTRRAIIAPNQDPVGAIPDAGFEPELPESIIADSSPDEARTLRTFWRTLTEARTFNLAIPAPRGQIVDRRGRPMAQNQVAHHLAISFPHFGDEVTEDQIVSFGRRQMALANRALGTEWSIDDDKLVQHYENRRWLPLVFSTEAGIQQDLDEKQLDLIDPLLGNGLVLHPAYLRHYPLGAFAPHVIGYTGKVRPLPVGPIQDGDPLFEETEGRQGLELSFNRFLEGQPGIVNVLFDADGVKLQEELIRAPRPGHNVVTTIDASFQIHAENALRRNARSGAFVLVHIPTGDILALASWPLFDPNLFIPGITSQQFRELNEDPLLPLFARSFRGMYPPASTYKVVTALAAIESGRIDRNSNYSCPPSFTLGGHTFRNHTRNHEGSMNVVRALMRSCNTWFYQVGLETGAPAMMEMSRRLGMGQITGVPLQAEGAGVVPDDEFMQRVHRRRIMGGDTVNMSIGQGPLLCTPLQAAQLMAAVANGDSMPQLRLVRQVQDLNDNVIEYFPAGERRPVNLDPEAREAVIEGMVASVYGSGATGRRAAVDGVQVAGKTGTGQWKPNRNLAWFAGFAPAADPVYAFAALYEGSTHERVSGGGTAAPIVHDVLSKVFQDEDNDDLPEIEEGAEAPVIVVQEDRGGGAEVRRAVPAEQAPAAEPPPAEPEEQRGFFRRLFGR